MKLCGALLSLIAAALLAAPAPRVPHVVPPTQAKPPVTSAENTPLSRRLDKLLADLPPGLLRAHWGIGVKNLKTGRILYQKNGDQLFTPASNAKLFTTALALQRLGPEYRYQTLVCADTAPDDSGLVKGDVRLIGGGDPTLSGRLYPYSPDESAVRSLIAIDEFADQLVAKGIRTIDGNIVGDDTAYTWNPYPNGWSSDDELFEYGAPVSALTLHDNTFLLRIRAGTPSGSARVNFVPPMAPYLVQNHIRTAGTERRIQVERKPGSRELTLSGTIPPGGEEFDQRFAVEDPALYAAQLFADALSRRGVQITGAPVAEHRYAYEEARLHPAGGVELARRSSPPLWQILQMIDKVSQNLHAEMVLREVGLVTQKTGTRKAALLEMQKFLAQAGIAGDDFLLEDASGLSRVDMVSPLAVLKLLAYMERSKNRTIWHSFLPVAGQDGTLKNRFEDHPEAARIHAKTGTLSRVMALSGYAQKETGDPLAFTILLNNYTSTPGEARDAVDKLALALLEEEPTHAPVRIPLR